MAIRGSGTRKGSRTPADRCVRLCRQQVHPHRGRDRHCQGGWTSWRVRPQERGAHRQGVMRKAQRADNGLGVLCHEDHQKLSSSPTAGTGQCPLPEARGSPGVSLPRGWAPAGRFHGKTFMKITKSFTAEQMPLQPVLLEMNEEQEARRAIASPAMGQPRQHSPSRSLRGQPRTAALPRGYPYRSVPHVCCWW